MAVKAHLLVLLSGAVTGICCHKPKLLNELLKVGRVPAMLPRFLLSVSGNSRNLNGLRAIRTQPVVYPPVVVLQVVWLGVHLRSPVRII
jgi:hypothetical protein